MPTKEGGQDSLEHMLDRTTGGVCVCDGEETLNDREETVRFIRSYVLDY